VLKKFSSLFSLEILSSFQDRSIWAQDLGQLKKINSKLQQVSNLPSLLFRSPKQKNLPIYRNSVIFLRDREGCSYTRLSSFSLSLVNIGAEDDLIFEKKSPRTTNYLTLLNFNNSPKEIDFILKCNKISQLEKTERASYTILQLRATNRRCTIFVLAIQANSNFITFLNHFGY